MEVERTLLWLEVTGVMLCPLYLSRGPSESLDAHCRCSQVRDPGLLMTQSDASEGSKRPAVQSKLCQHTDGDCCVSWLWFLVCLLSHLAGGNAIAVS